MTTVDKFYDVMYFFSTYLRFKICSNYTFPNRCCEKLKKVYFLFSVLLSLPDREFKENFVSGYDPPYRAGRIFRDWGGKHPQNCEQARALPATNRTLGVIPLSMANPN